MISASQTPATSAPQQTRRGAATAEKILDAAESCFATRGFEGTTLRDVADRVGIRIPSLYNHFPNKATLYDAVLERGMAPILELLSRFLEAGDETYHEPDRVASELMKLLGQRPNLPRLIQYELLAGGESLGPVLDDWLQPTIERSLTMIHASPFARRWKPEQLPLLLLAILNVVVGYFTTAPLYQTLYGHSPLEAEALARQTELFAQLVAMLGGSDEEPA